MSGYTVKIKHVDEMSCLYQVPSKTGLDGSSVGGGLIHPKYKIALINVTEGFECYFVSRNFEIAHYSNTLPSSILVSGLHTKVMNAEPHMQLSFLLC